MDAITDTIWISDIRSVREESTSHADRIITVCQESVADNVGDVGYYHFPLSDGEPLHESHDPGVFTFELFVEAVETIIDALETGTPTIVHCHKGQSRSVMCVITALASHNNESIDSMYELVAEQRNAALGPGPELQAFAKQYVNEE